MPNRVWLSADRRLAIDPKETSDDGVLKLVCCRMTEGGELWSMMVPHNTSFHTGTAMLPAPLGNVWLTVEMRRTEVSLAGPKVEIREKGVETWNLINEDGFVVARLFAPDVKKIQWPKAAIPGADMSNAVSINPGCLTHAADGKLYLQAGDSAAWNLEVTGLDKVRALPGGRIVVPAPPAGVR